MPCNSVEFAATCQRRFFSTLHANKTVHTYIIARVLGAQGAVVSSNNYWPILKQENLLNDPLLFLLVSLGQQWVASMFKHSHTAHFSKVLGLVLKCPRSSIKYPRRKRSSSESIALIVNLRISCKRHKNESFYQHYQFGEMFCLRKDNLLCKNTVHSFQSTYKYLPTYKWAVQMASISEW